jgi:hypothetical protein
MTKTVRVYEVGGPEAMQIEDIEAPPPARGEVLVRNHAIGAQWDESGTKELPMDFQVVIIKPTEGLSLEMKKKVLSNETFQMALGTRVLGELKRVTDGSDNAKVKSGFSLKFALMSDEIASKTCQNLTAPLNATMVPPNVFRAHLWPQLVAYNDITVFRDKIAPGPWAKKPSVGDEMKTEGGVGGRIQDMGSNFAFVALRWLEDAVNGPPPLSSIPANLLTRAGIWVGTFVAHELGHAMGIPKNRGKGLMIGVFDPDLDKDDPLLRFETSDAVQIQKVLEEIAKAMK